MDTSPKRERHQAELVQSRRSTSPISPTDPSHPHGWWSGIYNPHYFSVQELHERFHPEETPQQTQTQKPTTPESRDISNKVGGEEWARYRHKKSFFTDLGWCGELWMYSKFKCWWGKRIELEFSVGRNTQEKNIQLVIKQISHPERELNSNN